MTEGKNLPQGLQIMIQKQAEPIIEIIKTASARSVPATFFPARNPLFILKTLLMLILLLPGHFSTPVYSLSETRLAPYRKMLERAGFRENDETRRLFGKAINAPSFKTVETDYQLTRQIVDNQPVYFEKRKGLKEWYLIFRNLKKTDTTDLTPLWSRGNWIIKKDLPTGKIIQAKVFIQENDSSFVRIRPAQGNRSRLSIQLHGVKIAHEFTLPITFGKIIIGPFAQVLALTNSSIDWQSIFPDPASPPNLRVRNFVNKIDKYSDQFIEIKDAGGDRIGRNVYIETGQTIALPHTGSESDSGNTRQTGFNCSGYVKWIADSINSSWNGGIQPYLPIPPLRNPTPRKVKNPWSESRAAISSTSRLQLETLLRDPYFGLDWTRNLAIAIEQSRIGHPLTSRQIEKINTGPLNGINYIPDLGYMIEDLEFVLYNLAARSPGDIYLATFSSHYRPENESLQLYQYWHVSVLAPWFDNSPSGKGQLRAAVLDTGETSRSILRQPGQNTETRFIRFLKQKAAQYAAQQSAPPQIMVHLVRVSLPDRLIISPPPKPLYSAEIF